MCDDMSYNCLMATPSTIARNLNYCSKCFFLLVQIANVTCNKSSFLISSFNA